MPSEEDVERFIRSSFRSVWSFEVLLLLKRERRAWSHDEIVTALRASDLIVYQSLVALTAAGLVAVDASGGALYSPAGKDLAALVEEAESLYARSPDAVRRMIVVSSTSGLTAFADAFRVRKD